MSMNHHLPKKISLAPKKHHGFQAVLFLLGCLLPPLAVALRFGIGSDFFLNTFLCICGYFPCHFHNFYIQNIRNNQNRARTPKWAVKYGLVDNSDRDRRLRKSQWSKRFDERNAHSTHDDQALEDGEEGANYDPTTVDPAEVERRRNEGLWTGQDEEYYNPDQAPNQRNWHYPANFEGTVGDGRSRRGNSNAASGGDRWQRAARRTNSSASASSSDTYPPAAATDDDVPEWGKDYGSKRRSSKNKKQQQQQQPIQGKKHDWANNSEFNYASANGNGRDDSYGAGAGGRENGSAVAKPANGGARTGGDPNWDHEF